MCIYICVCVCVLGWGATALFESSMDEMPHDRQFHSGYRTDGINSGEAGRNNRDSGYEKRSVERVAQIRNGGMSERET